MIYIQNLSWRRRLSILGLLALLPAVLLVFQNCGSSFEGAINMQAQELPSSATSYKYSCEAKEDRGKTENGLRRLNRVELVHSLTDIFGKNTVESLAGLSSFPNDVFKNDSVTDFDHLHGEEHVNAILRIASEIASGLVANPARLDSIASPCLRQGLVANDIQTACLNLFISGFGAKVHRRILSEEQLVQYRNVYHAESLASLPVKDRLETLIARILIAPEMHFHWVGIASAPAGGRAQVDQFTIASRLSYRLTDGPPDAELFHAATERRLTNLSTIQQHADRLIQSPRGRAKTRAMFHHWLRLNHVPTPNAKAVARAGLKLSDPNDLYGLRQKLIDEALDYAEHVIYEMNGTYNDLMTSNVAVPRHPEVAQILSLGIDDLNKVSSSPDGRLGILMRPAILLAGGERDSPILRGTTLRTRLLCDPIPPPPADLDGEISDIASSVDHTDFSTRDFAGVITGQGSCVGCHSFLNPLGFALSSFGPLGEHRSVETTYNPDGTVKQQFPINSAVSRVGVDSFEEHARDHQDLALLIGKSVKGRACFAQYAYRTSRLKFETPDDSCQLRDVEMALSRGLSLKDALIVGVANDDIFWKSGL